MSMICSCERRTWMGLCVGEPSRYIAGLRLFKRNDVNNQNCSLRRRHLPVKCLFSDLRFRLYVISVFDYGTVCGIDTSHARKQKLVYIRGASKRYPLKNFTNFFRKLSRYSTKLYALVPFQLSVNMDSFITLSTELAQLRCF